MVFPGASDLQESEEKIILMEINERNNVRVYYNVSSVIQVNFFDSFVLLHMYNYVSNICL